jgi:hypothetical protein
MDTNNSRTYAINNKDHSDDESELTQSYIEDQEDSTLGILDEV